MRCPDYKYDKNPIRSIDDWRVPYFGRYATEEFNNRFKLIKPRDEKPEFWSCTISEECEEDEWDKDETCTNLEICFSSDNAGGQMISNIVIANHRHWSTISDFRDLHSSKSSCSYGASDEVIAKCIEILDACTEDRTELYVLHFAMYLAKTFAKIKLVGIPERPCLEWDDARASVELVLLSKFVQKARSFPEVFYSPVFVRKLHLLSSAEHSIYAERIRPLLNLIALDNFYKDSGLERMREACVNRLMSSTDECCQILGITENVARAAIAQRIIDLLKDRYYESIRMFGAYSRPTCASMVEWNGKPIARNHFGLPCIPNDESKRAICIMNEKDECVGVVTDRCDAYETEVDCRMSLRSVGKLDEDDQVLDQKDQRIGVYTMIPNGWRCPNEDEYVEISVTPEGLILNGNKYVGYIAEMTREGNQYRPCDYTLPAKDGNADRRLFGLFLFGFVNPGRIMLVRELRDCHDENDTSAPF